MKTLTKVGALGAAASTALVALPAHAQATGTLADLTSAADFADVRTAMITIALGLVSVVLLYFGIRKVISSIRGG